jgi:prepilin-type N-terminal cleavage/methylation domain-containing protein
MNMHKHNAFTLVELVIVISVIGILASMTILTYNSVQKDTRDSARSSKTTIITEALEKYYRANIEYPAVLALAGQPLATAKTKLNLLDAEALTFPGVADGTNSISSTTASTTQIKYEASGGSNCRTSSTGYCDAFRLSYVKEANGQTVTIQSREGTFVP